MTEAVREGQALVTVEVYLTDEPEKSFIIAGQPEEATRAALRLARVFDVPAPREGQVLELYVTAAEFKEHADPVLKRFRTLGFQYLKVVEQHRPKDDSRVAVEVSPRLHDEIADQEDELLAVLEDQLRAYDLGPEQTLVYRWPVGRRSGGEVMLAVMMDLPNNCIRVGYEDDFDWDAVEQQGVSLGGAKTLAAFNGQLRQLRRPN
jgi:hypothetical protein